jgi:hypothetical protein
VNEWNGMVQVMLAVLCVCDVDFSHQFSVTHIFEFAKSS